MKHRYSSLLLACLLAAPSLSLAQTSGMGSDPGFSAVSTPVLTDTQLSGILTGSMPCPDNTVYSEAVDLNVTGNGKGVTRSDRGYSGLSSQNYQLFQGVSNPVSGIRVFAVSTGSSLYEADNARFNLDADGNMTKPLRLAVAFYTISNGYPGTEVYKEEIDVYGEKCAATYGEAAKGEPVVDVYSFTMNLSEKVRMESGYVSVYAVQGDELASSCFALVHDNNIQNVGYVVGHYWSSTEDTFLYDGGFNFCFLGDPEESLAQKGLKLNRVLAPATTENGPYAKVQVELNNYGSSAVSDATLSLYEGDELLATETVGETIYAGTDYKYTFQHRIDCSAAGLHSYTIVNNTPGDEGFADKSIAFTTKNNEGLSCTSQSGYYGPYTCITRVKIGNISNESSYSVYSDFRSLKTDIRPGQTLTLFVDKQAKNGDYLKVWVDWNGNGVFDDEGEFIGYMSGSTTSIAIPTNVYATAGEKTMRIILSTEDVTPCTVYSYGETEDYTLNVVREDGSAALDMQLSDVIFKGSSAGPESRSVSVGNTGEAALEANFSVEYRLPQSPDASDLAKAPALSVPEKPLVSQQPAADLAPAEAFRAPAKSSTSADALVLTYGNADYYANTGASATYVNYAHYYPASALKSIQGMQISSIDVFIASAAKKSYVAVWGGSGVQFMNGSAKVKQQFTPKENAWNHVELSTPVTIEGEDLFIGCALEGCYSIGYLVGTDKGPANIGFGDLISTENSNYWWSLADLGYDNNVLIKANVTGERTAAVSWLSTDKTAMSLQPGADETLTLTANATGLTADVYEAVVKVNSNDPLATQVKLPVYLDLTQSPASVSLLKGYQQPQFRIGSGRTVSVVGSKSVDYIALYSVDGRQLQTSYGTNTISASALSSGLYVVRAVFADGTQAKASVAIR